MNCTQNGCTSEAYLECEIWRGEESSIVDLCWDCYKEKDQELGEDMVRLGKIQTIPMN